MARSPFDRQDRVTATESDLVPVGTPIDLDNCAREPIHIPGSIQPRGVLLVVQEPTFEIRQTSANVTDLLGLAVDDVLGKQLSAIIGSEQAARIERAAAAFGDLRQRNPIEFEIPVHGPLVPNQLRPFDAILHRSTTGALVVELEIAYGERPFSFPNTYQAVRDSVEDLNKASTLTELYDTTAHAVRSLTGFDRVMVYRYDENYNGEVVAEAKRDDLNSFLGLHYPASDIPAQARALYEKNWLRLISDVNYTPAPLVPTIDPAVGSPIDLTHATLRSVSPIHVEYLKNMGVSASMSISLLRHGRLWGLIACHHYDGPHLPPYGTRAAAEFLGSTLSLRLVDQFNDDQLRKRIATQRVLARLTSHTRDEGESLANALLGTPHVVDLVPADGVALNLQGEYRVWGTAPAPAIISAIADWAQSTAEEFASTECIAKDLPDLDIDPELAAGALVVNLPDGQYVAWLRGEVLRSVDWGGDPRNKAIETAEGDEIRLSPRKSFERWREIVRQRSQTWTQIESEAAEALRRHLVESLYHRAQNSLRIVETLQRSLLPQSLPTLDGWELSAHYEPAAGGRVGGDWYDTFELRDGRVIVLIGDVAGHGLSASGTMAQLRNALRAQLFTGISPADALGQLNEFCVKLLPRAFATVLVARVDLHSGYIEAASAGHLLPYVVDTEGSPVEAPITLSPPIGVTGTTYVGSSFSVEPGQGLIMFSDGLVERRRATIDDGLVRLVQVLDLEHQPSATRISTAMSTSETDDDVTIVTLRRR